MNTLPPIFHLHLTFLNPVDRYQNIEIGDYYSFDGIAVIKNLDSKIDPF